MKTCSIAFFVALRATLALLLATTANLHAATLPDAQRISLAETFVDELHAGQFTNAVARFDKTMTAAMPADKLSAVWKTLKGQAGAFRRRHSARTESVLAYHVVFVTCEFARHWVDVKVVLDQAGKIAGLFFLPARKPDEQTPPYAKAEAIQEIELTFGALGWELPGTLTLPKGEGRFPAVILVHGSGPNDRDETIGPNKPFRDLAWGLASRGIAVLRYDKRTKVHAQKILAEGGQLEAITVREETTEDAGHALAWLRKRPDVDTSGIFLLGHSLGGMLAPRIASEHGGFAGLILLAGSTRPVEQAMVEQTEYIAKADGMVSDEEQQSINLTRKQAERVAALSDLDTTNRVPILGAPPVYWLDLRAYDGPATAAKLRLPMLILQGVRDYQVTEKDLAAWRSALATRKNVEIKTYPNLNHLFITGEGPSTPAEYQIPGFVDEEVVRDIARWIHAVPASALSRPLPR